MNNATKDALLEFLPTSKKNAVSQRDISDYLGIQPRLCRQLVQQLRHDGVCICSTPYDGYWISTDYNDVQETVAILRAHINTCTVTMNDILRASEN